MKIIVTGGTGFLGSTLINKLKNLREYDISSISRAEGIDMRDYTQLKKHFKKLNPEIIIHCAAIAGGIAINAVHPVEVFEDNTLIGFNVVKACNELGTNRMINIMPNCVYPGHLQEYEESKFWDGAVHESVLTIGLPKRMVWGHCFAYCQKNTEFKPVHLIFPNMYGPNDHFETVRSHALGALISKIVNADINGKKTVEIWGTGKPIREWLYVDDGAESILKTLESMDKFEPNEIMNIGVTKGISIIDLANLVKEIVGWNGEFVLQTEKPDGAMKKILIVDKMLEKLKWKPPTKLRDGIRETVEWYRQNRSNLKI